MLRQRTAEAFCVLCCFVSSSDRELRFDKFDNRFYLLADLALKAEFRGERLDDAAADAANIRIRGSGGTNGADDLVYLIAEFAVDGELAEDGLKEAADIGKLILDAVHNVPNLVLNIFSGVLGRIRRLIYHLLRLVFLF